MTIKRLGLGLSFLTSLSALAQTFTGANAPGGFQDFPLTLGPGATNLAIVIPGTTNSFSHLLLKKGVAPSDTSYDFIALANGQTNAINLEAPEFVVTNYFLRVRTPTNSTTHNFTVTVKTNVPDLRSVARPATKPINAVTDGLITSNSWHYFRVDIPTNLPGWRVVLYSTNNALNPELYLQTNQLPSSTNYLKRSLAVNPDTLTFTNQEAAPGAYFIGVFLPATTNQVRYTLGVELTTIVNLTWDPGTTHLGTQVYTNQNALGGDYYFRVIPQNTALGAWRTALNVATNEAHVYLQKGVLPTTVSATYKSERIGSDGFVVPGTAFQAGEEWFLMVRATPGSQWTLVTGEPFSLDLGTVATNSASSSGPLAVGAEGIRYFKTTTPASMLAWRLWLKGLTNSILVKKVSVPVATTADLTQSGQMLVVPPYLVPGQLYFVGVAGAPGAVIDLDSRQHTASDINFISTTSLSVTGFPYTTYRVQVPLDQLAWQITVAVTNGNPNVAVRRNFIPNEFNNDAYSEVPGTVTDSLSLVPPTLSDGTFFITVYGTNTHTFTLLSGPPVVTDINFTSMTVNDDPTRAGWRYYRISDLSQQLGTLGWDLFLQNFAPGTRIGLRRNAVPSLWSLRNNGANSTLGFYEVLSAGDFLQHPAHQADIWYVGVYSPSAALGPFTLITQPLTAQPIAFEGGLLSRTNIPTGKWQFFQFNVPPGALGWDLRFAEVANGAPRIVVRRDQLPTAWTNLTAANVPWNSPGSSFTFPSGNQWKADQDWTRRSLSFANVDETGRLIAMGMGQPLEPSVYYVGVIDVGGSNSMTYTLSSRGIGPGFSIPVKDLEYNGGITNGTVLPREAAYYRVQVPTNAPSWKIRLAASSGEVELIVLTNHIHNVDSGRTSFGKLMQKLDNEHYVLLPANGKAFVPAGTYYLAVVGEGFAPTLGHVGDGSSTYTLHSQGPLPIVHLGTLIGGGADLTQADNLEGGEVKAYTFSTANDAAAFELRLEDRTGNPVMVAADSTSLPDPGQSSIVVVGDSYGNEGGIPGAAAPDLITCANCDNLFVSVMVKARGSGGTYSNATYTLRVHSVPIDPLPFDGGTAPVPVQTWGTFRYWQVDVPTNALGWDIRVKNVSGTGIPHMVISRDFLPGDWQTLFSPLPGNATSWESGEQWAAGSDWTRRIFSATGATESGRLLAMGMGRPLSPGQYIVGVLNDTTVIGADTSYTVESRGIGSGFSIPVVDLAFNGGTFTHPGLAPREAAYFRVEVPAGAPSWQLSVSTNAGDMMLVLISNSVPNVDTGQAGAAGKAMQKVGPEQYILLPTNYPTPQTSIMAGTYYLAVISEGLFVTNANRIGIGTSSFTITSLGPMPVVDLGAVAPAVDLSYGVTNQDGGSVRGFQFSVPPGISSLEVHLDNRVGNPVAVVRKGDEMPEPGSAYPGGPGELYGNEGGFTVGLIATNAGAGASLVTLANPPAGQYSLVVKARSTGSGVFNPASYTVRISALTYTDVNFDGGQVSVTNQLPSTWRYFHFEVPTNSLGWDLRLANVSNGTPRLVIRRDLLPNSTANFGWSQPGGNTNWPSGNQWAANNDWTLRANSSSAVNENFRILEMGMGLPLEPGTYYAGVFNSGSTTNLSYKIVSRGIGDGLALPVLDLPYAGGSSTNVGLPPREAAYYRINIPTNAPSLKVKVASTGGELMLLTLAGKVPCVDSGRATLPGKLMQKSGNEHYVLLPAPGQSFLTPGTVYLLVASEGVNPANSGQIGIGVSSFVITCEGAMPVQNLGTIGGLDLVKADDLDGGESKLYQFAVPPGVSFEARLENRIGNPVMALRSTAQLPAPGQGGSGLSVDTYGEEGGQTPALLATNNITLPSPTNGTYTLMVKARVALNVYPDANYTVRVRQVPVPDLNFSAELNTNGLSNVGSGLLADNQRAYFRVVIPPTNNGLPVIGWRLDVSQSSGFATLRVRPNALPDDAVTTLTPFAPSTSIIAPPYLSNGVWYVEVRGSNTTAFTLTSRAVVPERPAWAMPAIGQPSTTPGLTAPNFGDSGLDTNGVPLAGDQGVDLAQGGYHFYAIKVPPTNSGIMRVQLTAISGNPDLYLRTNFIPTLSHRPDGQVGNIYDRSLASSVSEYGNFVPIGRTEFELFPGTWYLAVRAAGNANAHYRLRLSSGNVQDLSFNGGSASGQVLAGADWRYYKVQFPQDSPTNWWVTFSQQAGDVVMYIRDSVPPGNGASLTDIRDWSTDNKNVGPYPNYNSPGTYLITTPQLRPGSIYYIAFKANNDSIFTVSNNVSGGLFTLYPTVDFYGGSVSNVLAPNSEVTYRVYAPRDATRWIHYATNATTVSLFIENGYLPTKTASDDFRSTGANSTLSQFLLSTWPWVPNANYFVTITNSSGLQQSYIFTMDGRNALTDDNDKDGMLDAWERQYFGSTTPTAAGDFDGDGVSNLNEFLEGTNPADPNSLKPRLVVNATNGVVVVNPLATNYLYGTQVTLSATPSPGYLFVGWTGQASGTNNPLILTLTNNRTITAVFRAPGDDFAQRIPITGWSNTVTGYNTNATKEPGEPNHVGNPGGRSVWWSWTAPSSGDVSINTLGSTFNTLLAIYTGTSISNLVGIASNDDTQTNQSSAISFTAVAGTTYAIVVDGYSNASGNIVLQLKQQTAPMILSMPVMLGNGYFQFTLSAEPGYYYDIQASGNLVDWLTIATLPNPTGTITFSDQNAPLYPNRSYRAARAGLINAPTVTLTAPILAGGQFSFLINGPAGQVLNIETSTNLINWNLLGTVTNASGTLPYTDSTASGASTRHYRVVVQ